MPVPRPAPNHATYEIASGAPSRVAMIPMIATVRIAAPRRIRVTDDVRTTARDCHQLPIDQLTVPNVITTPASASDRPRTPVSIRGMK